MVLLDTGIPDTSREVYSMDADDVYSVDADDRARTRNPSVINRVL